MVNVKTGVTGKTGIFELENRAIPLNASIATDLKSLQTLSFTSITSYTTITSITTLGGSTLW